MSEKSAQKRQFILETARRVFMEKGYKDVSMKDIVDACGISRGGLYLYFDSVRSLFLEVYRMETEEADDVFSAEITEEATAADILLLFLKEQKKEILKKHNDLSVAVYEFFFAEQPAKKGNALRQKFDAASEAMEQLIEAGVENGEFYCEDPAAAARNIMFALEGMRIASHSMGISEAMVDKELLYIMQELVIEV